jgi:penicillin V acylase-like amidase (Ntn superfamily)
MNEYGVAISGLNVDGDVVYDSNKISLDRYEFRRLVLDHAQNVDEPIDLIRKYNNMGSETVHYLVSDARGKSAVIEYYNGQVYAHRNVEPW